MKRVIAAAILGLGALAGAGAQMLESVEVVPREPKEFSTERSIAAASPKDAEVYLELADSIEDQVLRLHGAPKNREFAIDQCYETSLTVMEEGPHLDLLDWKHYTSPWTPLKKLNRTDFRTAAISEKDREKFPEVTAQEIREAVTKRGGDVLGQYVSAVKKPTDLPCGVGVSKISFRVKVKDGENWKVIKTIHFLVPLGC